MRSWRRHENALVVFGGGPEVAGRHGTRARTMVVYTEEYRVVDQQFGEC